MFSDTLLTISKGNDPGEEFVTGTIDSFIYTYRMVLGDFDTDNFGNVLVWMVYLMFILCTVFNNIVMLNLLIAIISESFCNVKDNARNATY